MAINRTSPKKGKVVDIPDATITIGTATAGASQVSVAFTVASTPSTGGPVQKYTAISNPGSFTGEATASPVVVSGLTNGTAYTFQVAAANATGRGPLSSASASATPVDPASFVSIATVNITSNTDVITFSSIPSTYKHLQLRAITRSTYNSTSVGQSNYKIQFNGDTGANYSSHGLYGNGASAAAYGVSSQNQITAEQPWGNPGSFGAGTILNPVILDILDYQNTNKNKTIRMITGFQANSTSTNQTLTLRSGAWYSTSAITSITLDATAGAFSDAPFGTNTQWALYGIKG